MTAIGCIWQIDQISKYVKDNGSQAPLTLEKGLTHMEREDSRMDVVLLIGVEGASVNS